MTIRSPSDASRIGIATVQGIAIVVISHNLDNVFHVADRISVLRLGRHIATFDRRRTAREDVVAAITGAMPGRAVAA